MQRPIGRSHKAYTDIAQIEQMLTICLGIMIVKCWTFTKSVSRALAYSFRLFWEK